MAYLNAEERERLRQNLLNMSYNEAKARLKGMDKHGRLAYWRNIQYVGEWHTRFDLPTLGASVTLVESIDESPANERGIRRRDYVMVDVRVEPLEGNQS